eukprot:SAG22_NODE_9875_length_565_cov_0.954936_1_plen_86_part_10
MRCCSTPHHSCRGLAEWLAGYALPQGFDPANVSVRADMYDALHSFTAGRAATTDNRGGSVVLPPTQAALVLSSKSDDAAAATNRRR